MKKYIFLFFILLCLTLNGKNVLINITNTDGLSNNSVNCIYEDSEHILWVGTWDGLNLYNGKDIQSYRFNGTDSTSISNNIIRQIVEQNEQYVWVATDFGVNRWNRNTNKFERYYIVPNSKVPKQEKSFILGMSADKTMLCYVKGEGLFYFEEKDNRFVLIDLEYADYIKDFIVAENDEVYFLFQDGDVLHTDVNTLKRSSKLNVLKPIGVRNNESIFATQNYKIATAKNRLSLIDKNDKTVRNIELEISKTISHILEKGDELYISFYEGGCIRYNLKNNFQHSIDNIADHVSVFTLFWGSQNILWVGTDGQGILQLYDYDFPFATIKTDHPVRAFCSIGNNEILVGTKGGGIKIFDKKKKTIEDYLNIKSGLISNSVYAFYKNKQGDVFVGTEGEGINIVYGKDKKVEKLQIPDHYRKFKAVYSIYSTHSDSLLWIGTSGYGLIKLELEKKDGRYCVKAMEQYTSSNYVKSLKNDVVYAITSDKQHLLWFGTRGGGLNQLDIVGNEIKRLESINDDILLTNNDILSIYSNSENIWIGTSYGLNKLNARKNSKADVQQFTEADGLANSTIHGIVEDNQKNIWISSNMGLSMINSQNKIQNYTTNIGLQNDEFSDGAYFKDENIIYFGGVSGFNYFNPQSIKQRNYQPSLTLTSFKIYDNSQNIKERIEDNVLQLGFDEQYVMFNFIAKDFINNQNCEYAYRLLPENKEWINMGTNSTIIFTKLSWGNYTLEVKSTNGDQIWANEIYKLKIKVGRPWWLSTPAITIYLLLIAAAIYIAQSIIKNRIRMSRKLLIEQIEILHQQKSHEAKLNFFTNVAHEFFTPLTLIYGPAQHLLEEFQHDAPTKRYLEIIMNNAERMQKLISELMEFRKAKTGYTPLHPENIDINTLINYVSENYSDILQENGIDYKVDTKNISTLYTDRDSLEKIFINLVSNAFKYTPNNGYIHLDIFQDEVDNNSLNLKITNSGKGLTPLQIEEIFDKHKIFDSPKIKSAVSTGVGLNLTKSLVEILGGEIDVESQLGEFVCFTLHIPPLSANVINIVKEDRAEIPSHNHELLKDRRKKPVTILIVEDDKNIRELLRDILSSHYSILDAENGQQAIDIVKNNHPDIIITDIMMPIMDGIKMIDVLKSEPKTRYIPIVSISAKTAIEDQIEAYKHGADLYITKPFHPKYVLSTIESLVENREYLKDYYQSYLSSVSIKDGLEMHIEDQKLVSDIVEFIHNNIDDETLDPMAIADHMHISKATLYRKIKDIVDTTPSEFIRTIRLEYSSKLLLTTRLTVSEIMYMCGFANKSYFYREFGKLYGLTPMKYREDKLPK